MYLGFRRRLPFVILLIAVCLALLPRLGGAADKAAHLQVIVPEEDRFTPFAQTIHVGDVVKWINMDTDDHTVVSDDFLNTTGRFGLNVLLKGTENNNDKPGTFSMRFTAPGTFVYYCRFHSHLDAHHQPAAPGPDGGIQADDGNYGTPMMGVITVLPEE